MKLSAHELTSLTRQTGRWRIDHHALVSPLLGATLTFTIEKSSQLTVLVHNHANPLSPSQYFTVQVDNGPWHRWPASRGKWTLPLTTSRHQVTIMTGGNCDLDDVWGGQQIFAIQGLDVDSGSQLQPIFHDQHVLILGDSITAGCWVAGKHASVDYRPESNYVGVAQKMLPTVEFQRVAYSAAGVLRPGTGNVPVAIDWLDHFDAHQLVSPQHYDLVIVALGVNDQRFSQQQFSTAYQNYIHAVLHRYQTDIALMVPFLQTFKDNIQQLGQQLAIPVINTANWCHHTVDGLHPDQQGSLEAGHHFAQVIQQLLQ